MKETQSPFEFNAVDNDQAMQKAVTCLGMTFANEEERRNYFTAKLREKLQEPAFRQIEGFPIGDDEDILALSDPPYYTACPNPWIADFIAEWDAQKPEKPAGYQYHREPFAADVSEGKNDPIYNAHSYHTKVPPKAIMRYILHYTIPGDIILDGFSGSGMVGVAIDRCSAPDHGTRLEIEESQNNIQWGERNYILSDLSPIATFISENQTTSPNIQEYHRHLKSIVSKVKNEFGWVYDSVYSATKRRAELYHVVWSEVYNCPSCGMDVNFWDSAVDHSSGQIAEQFKCPSCDVMLSKKQLERKKESFFHEPSGEVYNQSVFVPVASRLLVRGDRSDYPIQESDLETIRRVENIKIPFWYPSDSIKKDIDMWYERDYTSLGVFHLDSFYTKRNLLCYSALWDEAKTIDDVATRNAILFTLTGMAVNLSKMNRWRHNVSFPYNPLSGTLYVGSLSVESNVFHGVLNKGKRLSSIWQGVSSRVNNKCISTQATQQLQTIQSNSVDYILGVRSFFRAKTEFRQSNCLIMVKWTVKFTDLG